VAVSKTIGTLLFRIESDTKALKKGMAQTKSSINNLKKSFTQLAGAVGIAFGAQAVIGFTKEIIKLAGEMEGVSAAFAKLNTGGLLEDLQKATRGTVTDLELMRKAVQASNFKIPLSQLATYFEFATKRAIQTGESVDYLVQSIITGIGRKSVLVMDNLGISAVELQEEVRKVGDFGIASGNIISRELKNMGDVASTTKTETARLATTWKNVKTELGEAAIEAFSLNENLSGINDTLSRFNGDNFTNVLETWKNTFIKLNPLFAQFYWMIKGVEAIKAIKPKRGEFASGYTGGKATLGKEPLPQVPGAPVLTGIGNIGTRMAGSDNLLQKIQSITASLFDMSEAIAAVEQRASVLATQTIPQIIEPMVDLGIVVQQAFQGAVDAFGSFIEALASGNIEGAFDNILVAFAGFVIQMGKMIAAYGIAMLALRGGLISPGAAIAAGLALVAIGSAISGLASRGPSMSGVSVSAAGGGGGYSAAQPVTVLRGKDIYISGQRGGVAINNNT